MNTLSEFLELEQFIQILGLGTWYLPFGDTNSQSASSKYLDCDGGVHNGVSHSDTIVPNSNYVIFFQWMPDPGNFTFIKSKNSFYFIWY